MKRYLALLLAALLLLALLPADAGTTGCGVLGLCADGVAGAPVGAGLALPSLLAAAAAAMRIHSAK